MRRRALLAASLSSFVVPAVIRPARADVVPVVLELFTSQGCSSCPPADALLGRLVRRPGMIALAWHVDYWDRLGWRDPFASRAATERQRAYAARLGAEVYTPALVIGGRRMEVGSDPDAIEAAIATTPAPPVAVSLRRTADGLIAEVGTAPTGVMAMLAFYEPEHTTRIGAGENGGRQLTEYRIVRTAQAAGIWDGTARRIALPSPPPGQGAVLLVQSDDLAVVGAADLPA